MAHPGKIALPTLPITPKKILFFFFFLKNLSFLWRSALLMPSRNKKFHLSFKIALCLSHWPTIHSVNRDPRWDNDPFSWTNKNRKNIKKKKREKPFTQKREHITRGSSTLSHCYISPAKLERGKTQVVQIGSKTEERCGVWSDWTWTTWFFLWWLADWVNKGTKDGWL